MQDAYKLVIKMRFFEPLFLFLNDYLLSASTQ